MSRFQGPSLTHGFQVQLLPPMGQDHELRPTKPLPPWHEGRFQGWSLLSHMTSASELTFFISETQGYLFHSLKLTHANFYTIVPSEEMSMGFSIPCGLQKLCLIRKDNTVKIREGVFELTWSSGEGKTWFSTKKMVQGTSFPLNSLDFC